MPGGMAWSMPAIGMYCCGTAGASAYNATASQASPMTSWRGTPDNDCKRWIKNFSAAGSERYCQSLMGTRAPAALFRGGGKSGGGRHGALDRLVPIGQARF